MHNNQERSAKDFIDVLIEQLIAPHCDFPRCKHKNYGVVPRKIPNFQFCTGNPLAHFPADHDGRECRVCCIRHNTCRQVRSYCPCCQVHLCLKIHEEGERENCYVRWDKLRDLK